MLDEAVIFTQVRDPHVAGVKHLRLVLNLLFELFHFVLQIFDRNRRKASVS